MQDRVYAKTAENPSNNGSGKKSGIPSVPAHVPDDPLFAELMSARTVSYSPLVSRALRYSEAPQHLLKYHLHAATIFFSNLLYWTPKSAADGWVYKSRAELERETDLGRRGQERGRDLLREAGILEEQWRQGRMYYRVRWAGLKPLLRLAQEASGAKDPGTTVGPASSAQRSVQDPGTTVGPDPGTTVEPPSVITTQDEHPVQDQSSAREPESGNQPAPPATLPTDDDRRQTKNGSLAGKSADADGDRDLKARIIREVSELPSGEVTAEANRIGTLVAEAVGRKGAPGGFVSRLAELCIRRDAVELLGEVAARSKGTEVKHPQRYLAACLAAAIKDEEGRLEERASRSWGPASRFEAVYAAGAGSGSTAATDASGRRSLTGSASAPVYGVRNPEIERPAEDYFRKGGVQRGGGGSNPHRTAPDPAGATADARPQERGGSFSVDKLRRATGSPGSGSATRR